MVQAGQYVYVARSLAVGVPGPVTFGLAGLIALWQLDVAYRAPPPAAVTGRRQGWAGTARMLAVGLGAMIG